MVYKNNIYMFLRLFFLETHCTYSIIYTLFSSLQKKEDFDISLSPLREKVHTYSM